MSRDWKTTNVRRWRVIRAAVLEANRIEHGGRCQLRVDVACPRHGRPCPGICTGIANQVHHIRGKAYGDRAEELMAACAGCNLHVGNPSAVSPPAQPRSSW